MIEIIDINSFEIVNNTILCKVDIDFDYVEIPGPNGTTVSLQITDNTVVGVNAKNVAISGTVISVPEQLKFHKSLKTHEKGVTISASEFEAMMRETMPHDCDLDVSVGDKVIFNYKNGIDSESEGRLFKDVNIGYVTLLKYETLYAKIVDTELIPLNGWILFLRDQEERFQERESGIVLVKDVDKYGSAVGTVVAAGKPNNCYIDKGIQDDKIELTEGDRIVVMSKFGHRIVYDLHAGKFEGIEAIKRKNILALLNK